MIGGNEIPNLTFEMQESFWENALKLPSKKNRYMNVNFFMELILRDVKFCFSKLDAFEEMQPTHLRPAPRLKV